MFKREFDDWVGNIRGDILAGLVSAFAIIPEVIGFAIVAGVSPMMALYASVIFTIVLSFFGGRPAMVSAAAGSMALVVVTLVKYHGIQYLLAATILCGIFQIILGALKIGNLLRFIPKTVMTGFVDALAILIFSAQLKSFVGEVWQIYLLVGIGMAIIYLFPYVTKKVPSSLIAIIVVTSIAVFGDVHVRTIGSMGNITAKLPSFLIPSVPLNLHTIGIILPYSLSLAFVGLIETLLTNQVVDNMTKTDSNKNRECKAQGLSNIICGFFGSMCGCAMIGQAIVMVRSGGRKRLSTFVSGAFLMTLIFIIHGVMVRIPLAALVAVMITVSVATFDWRSLITLHKMPVTNVLVIIVTVSLVVLTGNLAIGTAAGISLTIIFHVGKAVLANVKLLPEERKPLKWILSYKLISDLKGGYEGPD